MKLKSFCSPETSCQDMMLGDAWDKISRYFVEDIVRCKLWDHLLCEDLLEQTLASHGRWLCWMLYWHHQATEGWCPAWWWWWWWWWYHSLCIDIGCDVSLARSIIISSLCVSATRDLSDHESVATNGVKKYKNTDFMFLAALWLFRI